MTRIKHFLHCGSKMNGMLNFRSLLGSVAPMGIAHCSAAIPMSIFGWQCFRSFAVGKRGRPTIRATIVKDKESKERKRQHFKEAKARNATDMDRHVLQAYRVRTVCPVSDITHTPPNVFSEHHTDTPSNASPNAHSLILPFPSNPFFEISRIKFIRTALIIAAYGYLAQSPHGAQASEGRAGREHEGARGGNRPHHPPSPSLP